MPSSQVIFIILLIILPYLLKPFSSPYEMILDRQSIRKVKIRKRFSELGNGWAKS